MSAPSLTQRYKDLQDDALAEVERQARAILRRTATLDEFVMGMGTAFFTLRSGKPSTALENSDDHRIGVLRDFIGEWDEVLRLTGAPMRFTARGEKITTW